MRRQTGPGSAWSSGPEITRHKEDRNRSIGLRTLLPLLGVPATFVSLQRDVRAVNAQLLHERDDMRCISAETSGGFSDTAALISHLDLVITGRYECRTLLAGALHRPVWILLPFIPDWRWLLDREDSPWYPTARLFRQAASREWQGAVGHLHDALRDWIGSRPNVA